jgi:acetoin utilization deacetylase AcuC-like enzyme
LEQVGQGRGEGFTANFPLPPGTGDTGFLSITEEFILPIMDHYRPKIVLISYGFDPHWRDPLGHLQLSASGYGLMIQIIKDWVDEYCSGKMALFLEGGYDLLAASACTESIISTLTGMPWVDQVGPSPNPEGKSWMAVTTKAREIWKY